MTVNTRMTLTSGVTVHAMYRCKQCHRVVPPGKPAAKCVVETRERVYTPRGDANPRGEDDRRSRSRQDPGGSGREIVREELLCEECAAALGSPPAATD